MSNLDNLASLFEQASQSEAQAQRKQSLAKQAEQWQPKLLIATLKQTRCACGSLREELVSVKCHYGKAAEPRAEASLHCAPSAHPALPRELHVIRLATNECADCLRKAWKGAKERKL